MNTTEKLVSIFHIVSEWLKFAEAKNAILIAFSGAGISAIMSYFSANQKMPNSLKIGLLISMSLLCISSLISSLSFLPQTDINSIISKIPQVSQKTIRLKDTDNFYYFNELKKYSPEKLLEAMNKLYFENQMQAPYKKEYVDLATQIVVNSEIASMKFNFFKIALYTSITSILILLLSFILFYSDIIRF